MPVEADSDKRPIQLVHVTFKSGESHRYTPASFAKLYLEADWRAKVCALADFDLSLIAVGLRLVHETRGKVSSKC